MEIREGDSLNIKMETKPINTEIGTVVAPKREGYTFDGWYTSPAGGEKVTPQTIITENVTYYAHWIYNQ